MVRPSRWLTVLLLGVVGAMVGALVLQQGWALTASVHRLLEVGIVVVGFGLVHWCTQADYLAALRRLPPTPPLGRPTPPAAGIAAVPRLAGRPPAADSDAAGSYYGLYTSVIQKN